MIWMNAEKERNQSAEFVVVLLWNTEMLDKKLRSDHVLQMSSKVSFCQQQDGDEPKEKQVLELADRARGGAVPARPLRGAGRGVPALLARAHGRAGADRRVRHVVHKRGLGPDGGASCARAQGLQNPL